MARLPHPGNLRAKQVNPFRIRDLPERIRDKITVRGAQRTACWIWTGTIRPARQRSRIPRYAGRVHEVFENLYRLEADLPLPQVWDSYKGAKVAAHRSVRSRLTCVPIDDVPRLSRCHDPRCVSPFHNMEIGPTPRQTKTGVIKSITPIKSDVRTQYTDEVLAILKEKQPTTSFQAPEDFLLIEQDCDLPNGSLTLQVWHEYIAWNAVENPDDDD